MTHDKSDIDTVREVARLARLAVDDEQAEAFAESFRRTLKLAEQIEAADTGDVSPMAHPMDLVQRLRKDKPEAANRRDEFLALAPAADGEYFLVPRVIE